MRFEVLLHQLYQTTRIISKGLNKTLEPLGIYTSEWSIILVLKENGTMTQAGLASYLNIEPPAITNCLGKLEKKGLIERKPGADKRQKKVSLTRAALEQYTQWADAVTSHRDLIFVGLPESKQEELYLLLKTVYLRARQIEEPDK